MSAVITHAITLLGRYGWGPQGRTLGISKMFQDADVALLKSQKAVAALRPRGILSGFLVVTANAAVFVPPPTGRQQPYIVRLRLSLPFVTGGYVFSAYGDNGDIVLEDVLVWEGKGIFAEKGFAERWELMGQFMGGWQPDNALQGCTIRFAEYMALADLLTQEPEERQVVEFVPLTANGKRLVWVPVAEEVKGTIWLARREALVGPDIYSLWTTTGEKQSQHALVRTLAISRALRLHPAAEFRVNAVWNKMFERWEILGIA